MLPNPLTRLIFVYNADSGLFNTLTDIAHKMLSPSTYSCNLCAITHGLLKERQQWRRFIEQLGIDVEFLHRDEFEAGYRRELQAYPAILASDGVDTELLISATQINACEDMPALQQLITEAIH